MSGPQTSSRPHKDSASFPGRRGPGEAAGGKAAGGGDQPGPDGVLLGSCPPRPQLRSLWGVGVWGGAVGSGQAPLRRNSSFVPAGTRSRPATRATCGSPRGRGGGRRPPSISPPPISLPLPLPPPRRPGASRASLGTCCIPPLPRAPPSWCSQTIPGARLGRPVGVQATLMHAVPALPRPPSA